VSVADSTWVRLWTLVFALAYRRGTSAAGRCRSEGWALAVRVTAAETCGVAIEVSWIAV
jgi:hypothetical protein